MTSEVKKIIEKYEKNILKALYNLLTNSGKLTMEKAAQDQGINPHLLLVYTNEHSIPLISQKDNFEALTKVLDLMKEKNVDIPK